MANIHLQEKHVDEETNKITLENYVSEKNFVWLSEHGIDWMQINQMLSKILKVLYFLFFILVLLFLKLSSEYFTSM